MPTNARATALGLRCGHRRRTRWGLAPPASPPTLPLARRGREQQRRALCGAAGNKALPPRGELRGRLAALDAQHEEIVGRAEPRVHEEAERPLAGPLVEPRLQRPDLLHRRGERSLPALYVAMDEVLDLQTDKLAIPRRLTATMKEIWSLQPRPARARQAAS